MTKQRGLRPIPQHVKFPTLKSAMRHTFAAPTIEQFKRASYLEDGFRRYAVDIGCTIIHDEITATDQQAMMLRSWWEEHRL